MKIRRFPRTVRRFPRTQTHLSNSFSMNKIYETLYKIAKGKPVSTKEEAIACHWYGLSTKKMTKEAAKHFSKGGSIRFPRSKHGKKS